MLITFQGEFGNYVHYRNDRSFDSLDHFIMSHLRNRFPVPVIKHLIETNQCVVYILGTSWFDTDAIIRIGIHLVSSLFLY